MPKFLRYFLYALAFFFVLGIIARLGGDNKPTTETDSKATTELTATQKDSIAKAEAETIKKNTIPADNLVSFYMENEVKADKELKDKEFYVSGKIDAIAKDITNNIYITLKSQDPIRNVQCFIDDENAVAELSKGQKVLVKGTCSGLMMNVLMKDCQVINKP
ncbi:hypothetical protein IC229_33640 [Spirosoma sp. BT702]|uniref:tRNA_anti-like n=1 Tax=Spirosoma profusum TaxID=2771354 RepID=A0A927AW92_9BACT|nr:hypothetical protein [Spirosoma profusum]MBD2705600.1 hypothetical protein [Spirosoma profusum]